MMTTAITPSNVEVKHYPIKKAASMNREIDSSMSPSLLWKMQQRVFDAKRELLAFISKEGYVPVDDDFDTEILVEVTCYVTRHTVDGKATDGKWIKLPVDMSHLSVATQLDSRYTKW